MWSLLQTEQVRRRWSRHVRAARRSSFILVLRVMVTTILLLRVSHSRLGINVEQLSRSSLLGIGRVRSYGQVRVAQLKVHHLVGRENINPIFASFKSI